MSVDFRVVFRQLGLLLFVLGAAIWLFAGLGVYYAASGAASCQSQELAVEDVNRDGLVRTFR